LEKAPADRDASAAELAEDLRRYLADEPIRARRPSVVQRLRKWGRRHQGFVWSAAAVVVLGVLMAFSAMGIANQRITRERDLARAQRKRAREAVDKMYTEFAQNWLNNEPEMEEKQHEFLTAALGFYQEFTQEESTDPEHRYQTALAYQRLARLQT